VLIFIKIQNLINLIYRLVKHDFKVKYIGNNLGLLWAFIQPIVTILIFWFVFQVGFKSTPVGNTPFILWLIAGILPWFFIADSIQTATHSVLENSYLVKKVVFRVSLLPVIKIISTLFVHIFFIFFMFAIFILYKFSPSIYWIQILYYLFATVILLFALSWISSSIIIFFKDIGHIVSMFVQFGFWGTPIFWSYNILPEEYIWTVKYNPIFYIVEGYRDSLINNVWFWNKPDDTLYFWSVSIVLLISSIYIFKKLKPHFADVL